MDWCLRTHRVLPVPAPQGLQLALRQTVFEARTLLIQFLVRVVLSEPVLAELVHADIDACHTQNPPDVRALFGVVDGEGGSDDAPFNESVCVRLTPDGFLNGHTRAQEDVVLSHDFGQLRGRSGSLNIEVDASILARQLLEKSFIDLWAKAISEKSDSLLLIFFSNEVEEFSLIIVWTPIS